MTRDTWFARIVLIAALCLTGASAYAQSPATAAKPYQPEVGQPGKDVVWVPTSQVLVDKMLDMAKVTPSDYLVDLGSGDGRTVITAAKRGAKAVGIEFNPDMVELSRRNAAAAGMGEKATFINGDIFQTDFSNATVVTMFLLPDLNLRLRPTLLQMKPGTRVVSNSFRMDDWEPDETATVNGDCSSWCNALLWIVPAKVEGTWHTSDGDLVLTQKFQNVTGSIASKPISTGKLHGDEITFTAGNVTYSGHVNGNAMQGTYTAGKTGQWTAQR